MAPSTVNCLAIIRNPFSNAQRKNSQVIFHELTVNMTSAIIPSGIEKSELQGRMENLSA